MFNLVPHEITTVGFSLKIATPPPTPQCPAWRCAVYVFLRLCLFVNVLLIHTHNTHSSHELTQLRTRSTPPPLAPFFFFVLSQPRERGYLYMEDQFLMKLETRRWIVDSWYACMKTCIDMCAHRSVNISVCIEGENCCQELVRRYVNSCRFSCI